MFLPQQRRLPPVITNVNGVVVELDGGSDHVCTILQGGIVRCWGSAGAGKLGINVPDGWLGDEPGEMPPGNANVGGVPAQISTGSTFNCMVLLADKSLRCWGQNNYGQLGYGHTDTVLSPSPPVEVF